MLMPKKTKYRKVQRGTMKGLSKGAKEVTFGEFGLQALSPVWLSSRQIESMRVTISRKLKKTGKMFLRVFPDKPITKKPAETRMGKGKGGVELWAAVIKPGRILCELSGVEEDEAKKILHLAGHKLPIKTKFVKKEIAS